MRQYFKYHGKISSIELSQAFASIVGPGPFAGFVRGSWSTDTNVLTLYPEPNQDTNSALIYRQYTDEVRRRYISQASDDTSGVVNFGVIAKDGSIYTNHDSKLEVSIQGSKGTYSEILLFAVHSHVEQEVSNPVTLAAYWNSSTVSLFDVFKRSINPYYNTSSADINDPVQDSELNFTALDAKLQQACSTYKNNYATYTFIGVYGSGTNKDTNETETFNMVSLFNKFPMTLNYNTAVHGALIKSLTTITNLERKLKADIGTVHMYAGASIPSGYLVCNGQAISIDDYPDLYSVIGTTYNTAISESGTAYTSPESGKFRIPDLRSRFIIGKSDTKSNYQSLGKGGGAETVALKTANIPAHYHTFDNLFFAENHNNISSSSHCDGTYGLVGGSLKKDAVGNVEGESQNGLPGLNGTSDYDNDTLPYVTMSTNSSPLCYGDAHNNMPPYYTLYYIIKAKV